MSMRKPYRKPELHILTKDNARYMKIMQLLSVSSGTSDTQQELQVSAESDKAFSIHNHTSEKENRQQ